ncbi:hypothetical protein FB381_4084 [Nocardioides albertanoniae]|uniref:Uncharacterized protein n=1 Tax=Nocardioides albertanoniae TaxID=1175486 RepID=A0A543ACE3_9ACTN|nr:DUF6350 family protein [Nocardioides albertanoniae]TQL70156.1 hypothetical protein FB381_4084 [Nocardioides albertanoniae]
MSSLLPPRTPDRGLSADDLHDLRHRRPLVAAALLGGVGTAVATLLVCLAIGILGWFISDMGAHGEPSDAMRVAALGWLVGHGSGVVVSGVAITAVPLGLTLVLAWAMWQVAVRVGDSVSLHGPDANALADGERDLTVPVVAGLFTFGYTLVAIITALVAGTPSTAPSLAGVFAWSVGLCAVVALPAIAVGSGRAALWFTLLPRAAVDVLVMVRSILFWWLAVSTLVFFVALFADFTTSINVVSQLHLDLGGIILYSLLAVLVLPNAVLFSSAYALGPGFSVGLGTTVTPTAVTLGPLPMFPMLAALPDNGAPSAWVAAVMALGPLTAFVAVCRVQRNRPTLRWSEGALRGVSAGVVAGLILALASSIAGGAVGPGRMVGIGPYAGQVLVNAIAFFGLAGLLAGLAMTWWHRRSLPA